MYVSRTRCYKTLTQGEAKFIKSLRLKKYRQQYQAFVVEGGRNVQAVLSSNYTVQMLVGTLDFLQSLPLFPPESETSLWAVSEQKLIELGTLCTNSSALAVVRMPPIGRIPEKGPILALDNIQDPGNLGTIVRTADWYALPHVVCSLDTVELYNPKVLRASMGSFANVSVHYVDLPSYLQQIDVPAVGAVVDVDALLPQDFNFSASSILVIGNESKGIRQAVLNCLQQRITIPRLGKAASLNAAVAMAILCDRWRGKCTAQCH